MARPIVRTVTWQNGRWTVGAEVPRPRVWPRALANAAVIAAVAGMLWLFVDEAITVMGSMPHLYL